MYLLRYLLLGVGPGALVPRCTPGYLLSPFKGGKGADGAGWGRMHHSESDEYCAANGRRVFL
ncbi:hypothetical protein GCM10023213_25780 [Prosthecobacter algae]|uniref:Uncharacterized protein n=1 Tax=Prosthecobacter algae TaxID=1144682 RepID=A0ABP9PCQ5_9BACT